LDGEALQVSMGLPTGCLRFWLGDVLSAQRNGNLIGAQVQKIRACALHRRLLFCVDGMAPPATFARFKAV
jgi:hypothetical protein